MSWHLIGSASMTLAVDPLSAFFLAPIFLMGGLGAIYGLGYWRQIDRPTNARKLQLFWGMLIASMAVLVVARHAIVFLIGWEVMALSAFFLINTEDRRADVRASGWIYLVATHLGTLCLFAMFALMHMVNGSFALKPLDMSHASMGVLTATFALALVGFGLKAGIMPLHFWLPSAHANAPSHVSALFSGVMIKMGIYGLVRVTGLLPHPPVAWGAALLILGSASGVLGVVFAIAQHDLKRLLAYHSVENIGIIVIGLGLAMIGRSLGRVDWVVLGLAGCLLHVWNHSLFKSLLFLSAGSVVHATRTREIDCLGGLAKTMPWTAAMFLVGSVAICGLPPLNGFVSELLIYLGLFRTAGIGSGPSFVAAVFAVPILGAIGGLAVACFVKVYGTVFLGMPRKPTRRIGEAPAKMLLPMFFLACGCAVIGLVPLAVAPVLDHAIKAWDVRMGAYDVPLTSLVSLKAISMMGLALLAVVGGASTWLMVRWPQKRIRRVDTWGCGYAFPTARMQYTASSFAQMLVGIFHWVLRPQTLRPHLDKLFAKPSHFHSHVDDLVLERQLIPAARTMERWLSRFRKLQQGLTQHYVLYILIIVLVLMMWTMPFGRYLTRMFTP